MRPDFDRNLHTVRAANPERRFNRPRLPHVSESLDIDVYPLSFPNSPDRRYSRPSLSNWKGEPHPHDHVQRRPTSVEISGGVSLDVVIQGSSRAETDILLLNGTPTIAFRDFIPDSSRHLSRNNMRVSSFSRRGFGNSTGAPRFLETNPAEHFTYSELANDTEEVAEKLGLRDKLWLDARSGGIPHALAFAAKYQDRVKGIVLQTPALPRNMVEAKIHKKRGWSEGMHITNAAIDGMSEAELYSHIGNLAERIKIQSQAGLYTNLEEFPPGISDESRDDIKRLIARYALQYIYEQAIKQGIDGWCHEVWAFYHDWGIDFSKITAPVLIHNYTNDTFGQASHGEILAQYLPNALSIEENGTHFKAFGDLRDYLDIFHSLDRQVDYRPRLNYMLAHEDQQSEMEKWAQIGEMAKDLFTRPRPQQGSDTSSVSTEIFNRHQPGQDKE
ncbi:MAG TPA: alpha/beta hydrolase [Candidatus Saccharimonadales bacterium]|nr:alpha/beta hydrolase [Candidatus Saccharimonadales bacterium]